MFAKISRYRSVPDAVALDSKGRTLAAKQVRLLPEVAGIFRHTVAETDRLDLLAFRYYRQPRKWWRICDANPEILAPLALLGKEPLVTDRFPLQPIDRESSPPWAALRKQLTALPGVIDVAVVEEVRLLPQERSVDGARVTVQAESFERAVLVTSNRLVAGTEEIAAAILAAGFRTGAAERIGRTGKEIVIPPDLVRP